MLGLDLYDLVDVHLFVPGLLLGLAIVLLEFGHYHDIVIVVFVIVVLVIEVSDVEGLIIDGLIAVVDMLSYSIPSAVFFIEVHIFRLNKQIGTVSINQEGISLSLMSR